MPQCLAPEPFLVITAPYGLTLRAAFTVWQRGGAPYGVGWGGGVSPGGGRVVVRMGTSRLMGDLGFLPRACPDPCLGFLLTLPPS